MAGNKTRKRKRLKDIQSFEIAGVSQGANGGRFIISKGDGSMRLDLNKLTELHGALGKVITVCKAGTPAAETVEALGKDLAQIHSTLATMVGGEGAFDPVGLKTRVDGIVEQATSLSEATHDLNVQDQLDALLAGVKALDTQIAAMQTAAATEVSTGDSDSDSSNSDDSSDDNKADDDKSADDKGSDDNSDSSDDSDDSASSDDSDSSDDSSDSSDDDSSPETVTKADMLAFGKTLGDSIGSAMEKGFGQLATTLKSAPVSNSRGMLIPGGAAPDGGSQPAEAANDDSEADWGNPFDLLESK